MDLVSPLTFHSLCFPINRLFVVDIFPYLCQSTAHYHQLSRLTTALNHTHTLAESRGHIHHTHTHTHAHTHTHTHTLPHLLWAAEHVALWSSDAHLQHACLLLKHTHTQAHTHTHSRDPQRVVA